MELIAVWTLVYVQPELQTSLNWPDTASAGSAASPMASVAMTDLRGMVFIGSPFSQAGMERSLEDAGPITAACLFRWISSALGEGRIQQAGAGVVNPQIDGGTSRPSICESRL